METFQITQQWYDLATQPNDETNSFFRFIAVWVAFNGLYSARHRSAVGDKNKVLQFAGEAEVIDRHRSLLQDNEDYRQAICVLEQKGVVNLQNDRRVRISAHDNLIEVMTCIYTVRCNLFHGGKSPSGARNENLVASSYTIMKHLIEPYIGEWN